MSPEEYAEMSRILPDNLKIAAATQSTKLATVMTGETDFSIEKIAFFVGRQIAQRHHKWRPVANGLTALNGLLKG